MALVGTSCSYKQTCNRMLLFQLVVVTEHGK
uniref:Uncharacterized protein n=1 Tax=Arundo donax TaxID=35708 RepID=A0A0A9CBL4_ARUDO